MLKKIESSCKELDSKLEKFSKEKQQKVCEITKKWTDKLNETVTHEGKEYTFKERYLIAKKERIKIIERLNLVENAADKKDSDKGAKFTTKDIIRYGKLLEAFDDFIAKYEKEEEAIAKEINAIKYNNDDAIVILKEEINEIIASIDEEIIRLAKESSDVNLTENEINEIANGRIELIKFKNEMNKLLSYNPNLVKKTDKVNLPANYSKILEKFYGKIDSLGIDMNKKVVSAEKNYDLEEILYYLDIANNSNFKEEKRRQALEMAYSLTNELEDEELKESLFTDLASAYDSIKKDNTTVVDPDYEFAKSLVELAEKTEKSTDFINACDALEKVEESKRGELGKRLVTLRTKAGERFVELIEEIKKEIVDDNSLDNKKFLELEDRYKYISTELAKQYKDDFSNIIIFNNNLKQEEVKENYEKKKEGFFTKIGKIVTFVKGSKIASKFNVKKLLKLKASAQDVEDEEELEKIEEKTNKVSKKLAAGSIVGGLRLFVAQKRLENMKPKLYSGEDLSNRKIKIYNKAVQTIDKQLNKGLEAKSNLTLEAQDKKYVTSVIDQYLYLIATGEDYDSSIEKLSKYLEKVSNNLTDAEDNAIKEQMLIIKDYRDATDGAIYEIKSNIEDDNVTTELDDVIKYYDSEDYNKGIRNNPIYIKR